MKSESTWKNFELRTSEKNSGKSVSTYVLNYHMKTCIIILFYDVSVDQKNSELKNGCRLSFGHPDKRRKI